MKYGIPIDLKEITHAELIGNRISAILEEKGISPLLEPEDIKAMNLRNEAHWFNILRGEEQPLVFGSDGCMFQIAKWLDVEICDLYGMCMGQDTECQDCKSQEKWASVAVD